MVRGWRRRGELGRREEYDREKGERMERKRREM
jgi:hypothetical protein